MLRSSLRPWALVVLLAASCVAAPSPADDDVVPKTVDGGREKVKDGGREIGEGFRSIGRGIKRVFTGESSKHEFRKGKKIGDGFRDIGLGIAGTGRGVGRGIRDGVRGDGEGSDATDPRDQRARGEPLQEESLDE